MFRSEKRRWKLVMFLAGAGIAVTAYLIYQHFKPAGGSFCNISDFVSCDVVNKSIYSEILGIPVSILGFATYVGLFLGALAMHQKWSVATRKLKLLLMMTAYAGLAFSLYLTAVELFILYAICILCVTQQVIIAFISLLLSPIWPLPPESLKHS